MWAARLTRTKVNMKTLGISLHTVPETPGVYLMKDAKGTVLYVGKAKNLRARLTTYFSRGGDERVQIPYLLQQVVDVETILVPSEVEALLLEARLIQQMKPKYNVLLKDDKSHLRIRLDTKQKYPRLEKVRIKSGVKVPKDSFGPFVSGYYASQLFDCIISLFRLRQCTDEQFKRRTKPCLLYQLNRCSGACLEAISEEEYAKDVMSAHHLLKGKNAEILRQLDVEMLRASESLNFERASMLLQRKRILESAFMQLSTTKIPGTRHVDVIALHQEGTFCSLCVMSYREGVLTNSCTLQFDVPLVDEGVELEQLILQYYRNFVSLENVPSQLLVTKELTNIKTLQEALYQECHSTIEVQCPERGHKRALVELAEENAKVALLQKMSSENQIQSLLHDVQEQLGLFHLPHSIDCFDVSHLGGHEKVATCVSFKGGKPNKRGYRMFRIYPNKLKNWNLARSTLEILDHRNSPGGTHGDGDGLVARDVGEDKTNSSACLGIHTVDRADDCAMIQEAIERRYSSLQQKEHMPDLILVDGGKLQLQAALRAMEKIGCLDVAVRGLSKEEGRHDRGMTKEKIWAPGNREPLVLDRTSKVLHFLQRVRDEAHRFSITFQAKRRKTVLLTSQLDGIPGIGPKKKKALLTAFSGIDAIRKASSDELCSKAGLSLKDAERLKLVL